jgi:hypothetical protein
MAIPPAGFFSRLVVTFFLLCATALGPSPFHASQANLQMTSSSARRGAISGVVTDGATGRPLRGVLVSLSDPKVQVSVGTVTDSRGRFVFTDLPASDGYSFSVVKSAYYGDGFISSGVPRGLANVKLRLTDGEWLKNAVDIRLWPYGTLSGTVVDEQGEPVVGVPVHVLMQIAVAGSLQWIGGPMGITDDRGFYRIDELRRGTYLVHLPNVQSTVPPSTTSPAVVAGGNPRLNAPPPTGLDLGAAWLTLGRYAIPPPSDGRLRAYPLLYYPASRSIASAVPVELAHGENKAGIDFMLQPVATASVSGRVAGPPDALAGLVVRLLPSDSLVENQGSEQATALVDANGAFSMAGVPAGSYTLAAATATGEFGLGAGGFTTAGFVLSGFQFTVGSGPTLRTNSPAGGLAYFGRTQVAVGSQDVTDVVLELRGAATISGRVVNEDGSLLRDRVNVSLSPVTGDPKLMAPVAWVEPEAKPTTPMRFPTPEAAPGHFVFRCLQEGDYLLNVNGFLVVKSITLPDGDYTDRSFHASPGIDINDVVIAVTDRAATLSGVVHDRDGAVVNQSAVIIFPAERSQWSHFGMTPSRINSAIAFSREGYKLSHLRAGDYLVVAIDESQSQAWQDSRFLEAAAAVATPITLHWGVASVLDLTLQQVTVR